MDTFQKIEQLAKEVTEGKMNIVEAILMLPEDFSDCKDEITEMSPEDLKRKIDINGRMVR